MSTNTSEYNRLWRKRNKKKYNEIKKKHYHKNKEKYYLYRKIEKMINLGIIKRKSCQICGNVQSNGHHWNYDKPLELIWLCPKHHKEEHNYYLLC